MKALMLFATLITLTACTLKQPHVVFDSGQSNAQIAKDRGECLAQASIIAQGAGNWSSNRHLRDGLYERARNQEFERCFIARGYNWHTEMR